MAEARVVPIIEDQLAAAVMKVSKAHLLLSGVVEQAVRPSVKEHATTSLELLEEAVRELRDVAVSLRCGA
jgi:signal transduction histidine kinase